jgi:outer membrane protein TolC
MTVPARSLLAALLAAATALNAQTVDATPPADATEAPTGLSPLPAPQTEPPPRPRSPVADIMEAPLPAPPHADPLSLESAVAQALSANFDVQIQRLVAKTAHDSVDIARSDYDPTLSAVAATGQSRSASAAAPVRFDDDSARVSVTQKIPLGTTLTGTSRLDRGESNPAGAGLNPAYDSNVGLAVRQPLLKGAGNTINNAALDRARLGVERARADFVAEVYSLVRDVEVAYSNLALDRERLAIRAFSLEVRKKLLEENRARRDTGVATDLEVLQAEVGVATAARDLLVARQFAQESQDELLRLLGRETFDHPVGPVTLPALPAPAVDLARSLERARANTPEFESARASIRQQRLDVLSARNDRLPQLDLGAQAGLSSYEPTARNAVNKVWDGRGYAWQVDLSLSFPWGFREERARLRQARSGLAREELLYARIDQEVVVAVRNAVRDLETSLDALRLSSLTAELRAREFELEKARYDSGLSTFRRVQESQDDLDLARLSELQAKVALRTSQANLDRLEGSAAERYRLTLLP